ncbi:C69 family dipeptidase, partial [Ileibacterium valens]
MSCTTILVGSQASYDGSCMIARNDDTGAGSYSPKKFIVVLPDQQPRHYVSKISHVEI